MDKKAEEYLPRGEGQEFLHELMTNAGEILSARRSRANMIWPWGQGVVKAIPSFLETHKVRGSVISAVDLIKGLGKILSMRVVDVPGATGYLDTNYRGKAEYGLEELKESDLVYIHVEAPDEASHDGRLKDKIKALEEIDRQMVSLFVKALEKRKIDRLLIVADHFTPLKIRTHTSEPVPFVLAGEGIKRGASLSFSEEEADKSDLFIKEGHKLMSYFLENHPRVGYHLRI
jgi:2,3-bisphosphoglycerate-independent phosphoglycerate mutase